VDDAAQQAVRDVGAESSNRGCKHLNNRTAGRVL